MKIWQRLVRQAEKEYSAGARLAAIGCEGLIFVFGIPGILFWLSTVGGDRWRLRLSPVLSACCLVVAALGLLLALWTVWVQFRHARGTPAPVMATKKLLTDRPYALCRNPMALGTVLFYGGISIYTSSFAAMSAALVLSLCLVAYIKFIEEKEISARFGDEYRQYKQSTSFIIPRFPFSRGKRG